MVCHPLGYHHRKAMVWCMGCHMAICHWYVWWVCWVRWMWMTSMMMLRSGPMMCECLGPWPARGAHYWQVACWGLHQICGTSHWPTGRWAGWRLGAGVAQRNSIWRDWLIPASFNGPNVVGIGLVGVPNWFIKWAILCDKGSTLICGHWSCKHLCWPQKLWVPPLHTMAWCHTCKMFVSKTYSKPILSMCQINIFLDYFFNFKVTSSASTDLSFTSLFYNCQHIY